MRNQTIIHTLPFHLSKHLFHLAFLLILFGAVSCEKEYDFELPPYEKEIIIDGYIEQGKAAMVTLSYTTPYNTLIDSSSYYEVIATRAKVVVSDGENEEVLRLTKSNDIFPPHFYKGSKIKGEYGKTYTLKVYLNNKELTAKTTIPEAVAIDSSWFENRTEGDSLGFIWIDFTDPIAEKNYYRTFTKDISEKSYTASRMAVIDDAIIENTTFSYPLYQGINLAMNKTSEHQFMKGDTVIVRLATLTAESFEFWKSYNNSILNAGNPFAGGGKSLPSNVDNGLGIWCGYGTSYDTVVCN